VLIGGAVALLPTTAASAADSGSLTVTDRSQTPVAHGQFTSTARMPAVPASPDPQTLWNGGSFQFVPVSGGTQPQYYPQATGTIDAPASALCAGGLVDIDVSVTATLDGPGAGSQQTNMMRLYQETSTGVTPVFTSLTTAPQATPVGWSGTIGAEANGVPVAALADGELNVVLALETYDQSAKFWTVSGFTAEYTVYCPPTVVDDTPTTVAGEPVTFDPLANDSGDDGAELDATSVRLLDGGTPVETLTTAEGTFTVDTTIGEITFTPTDGFTGTAAPVTYQVTDEFGVTQSGSITVTVGDVVGVAMINGQIGLGALGLLVLAGGAFAARRRLLGGH